MSLQGLGRLVIVDPPAVEEEAERGDGDAHPLAVALLELAHLRDHYETISWSIALMVWEWLKSDMLHLTCDM